MDENTYGVYRVDVPGQIREFLLYHERKYGETPTVLVISQSAPEFVAREAEETGLKVIRKASVLPRDLWIHSEAEYARG